MMPDDNSCWASLKCSVVQLALLTYACHGDIDVVEMINGDGNAQSHYYYSTNTSWSEADAIGSNVQTFGSAYHEYAVEFDGVSHAAFAYDGEIINSITRNTRGGGGGGGALGKAGNSCDHGLPSVPPFRFDPRGSNCW